MRRVALAVAALFLFAASAYAQQPVNDRLTVFLDCRADGCDRNFLLTEIPYVLWTQDRLDAEIHLLVTSLQTGSDGSEFTLVTLGQRRFTGRADTLTTTVPPNSTDDARRRELARVMKLALMPYIARSGIASRLTISYDAPSDSASGAARAPDPWNLWVYRIAGFGSGDAESQSSSYSLEADLSARRITERWKLEVEGEFDYESNSFDLDSGTVSFALRNWEFQSSAIRSLTEHWSVGAAARLSMSQFDNQDLSGGLDFAAEYNYFPWREATSRQLIAAVSVGVRRFDYIEPTIYLRDSETRAVARAAIAAETRQPWGSLYASLEHSRYLHDASLYSIELDANIDVRITRGLSVEFGANAEKVSDQLYLPRGDASDDEVLTRQRALATEYRIGAYAGIAFTFGSIFNNIVNPRFDNF